MPDYKLSETELYIMRFFWDKGAMKSDEVAALTAGRGWKPTTLLTFLSRLAAKGMLRVEKAGKSNLYHPIVGKDEYAKWEGGGLIRDVYGGSARNFMAALVEGQVLSQAELAELKDWLDGLDADSPGTAREARDD